MFNYPNSGLNNAAEYISSGVPFAEQITTVSGSTTSIDFPFVTNHIYINNNGTGDVFIGFTENGTNGINRITVPAGEARDFKFRLKTLYVVSDGTVEDVDIGASLTTILTRGFPILTGSAVYSSTGSIPGTWGYDPGLG